MTILISHIPKTAGTSLRKMIAKNTDSVLWVDSELSLVNPNLEFCLNFRKNITQPSVVMGHFSYGVHRFLGVTPRYITCMRNPTERIVSHYRFHQSNPLSPFFEVLSSGMSLKDFLSLIPTETTNNHACRMISGIPPDSGIFIDEDWLFDLAIHNLERHYILVGIMENVDSFYEKLCTILGWKLSTFPVENASKGPDINCDNETKKIIFERNRLDIKLYEYVANKPTDK